MATKIDILFSPHTRGCSSRSPPPHTATVVFPAYAGMFLKSRGFLWQGESFPRIRGDVPASRVCQISMGSFSPHTRGCSGSTMTIYATLLGFPRIRGDVPLSLKLHKPISTFSPHTRGCSFERISLWEPIEVFPAYAGMFPVSGRNFFPLSGFPRIRGDVPLGLTHPRVGTPFSPHTRGCSSIRR